MDGECRLHFRWDGFWVEIVSEDWGYVGGSEPDGGGDMFCGAKHSIGWVKANPAGARKIDLGPSVESSLRAFFFGVELAEETTGKSCRKPKGAEFGSEEDSEISAGAAAEGEGF
jgi:hypothetical protein